MSVFTDYEVQVIHWLVRPHLSPDVIADVIANAEEVEFEHTGCGYFFHAKHPAIPVERIVCDTPGLTGECEGAEFSLLIFLMDGELTIECAGHGDVGPPLDIRERSVRLSMADWGAVAGYPTARLERVSVGGNHTLKIGALMQKAYAVESELIRAVRFPPLERSLVDINKSEHDFYAVIENDDFLGVMELKHGDGGGAYMTIESLVVDPSRFREGVGSRLVRFALEFASLPVRVSTAVLNVPAVKLYESEGFRQVGKIESRDGIEVISFEFVPTLASGRVLPTMPW